MARDLCTLLHEILYLVLYGLLCDSGNFSNDTWVQAW